MSSVPADLALQAALAGFRHHPHAILVAHGPRLDIVGINDTCRAMFPGREMVGLSLYEAWAELVGQQLIDMYQECYDTGEPRQGTEWRFALEIEGQVVESFVDFSIMPWRDADGAVVGVVCDGAIVTDKVLARQGAERARDRAEAQFRDAMTVLRDVQSVLLPEALPVLSGVDVAASYLLASDDTAAGGDWFDAVVKPDGRLALVVGDVVGHGVEASAVMGQLRAVLHHRLLAGASLEDALVDLDRAAAATPGARAATVCLAELDPDTGHVAYCTAGHPPPALVAPRSTTRFLEPTGSGPLATGTTFTTRTLDLAAGELLLLYSDGLVERPARTHAQNTVEVLQRADAALRGDAMPAYAPLRGADRVCQLMLEQLTRLGGHDDDMTILAAQLVDPTPPLRLTLPAHPHAIRDVREDLATWLDVLGAQVVDCIVVQQGIGELVANAVEHAHAASEHDSTNTIDVDVRLDRAGLLTCRVTDTGTWRAPAPESDRASSRGRGLAMTAALVDHLDVRRGTDEAPGTTATARHHLTRPAHLVTAETLPSEPEPGHYRSSELDLEHDDSTGHLRATGPIDALTAGALRTALQRHTRGGTSTVTLDLTGVTFLFSAGVEVLHEAVTGTSVELLAPYGSPAQHVLELVALPYATPPS